MKEVELSCGVLIGVASDGESPLDHPTFTLTGDYCDDRRFVSVASVPEALAELTERCTRWPQAAAVCDDVLRSVDPAGPTRAGVVTESLAYSTLQSGQEFARWLAERGRAQMPDIPEPVLAERDGDTLHVRFNRPQRHNAFSTDARAALLGRSTLPASTHPSTRWCCPATADPSAAVAISPSSAHSPTRPARTWPAPGTARRWRSTS